MTATNCDGLADAGTQRARKVRRLALRGYSEDELIEELARRKNERVVSKPIHWCDRCTHFKTLPESAPDDENPCTKGHKMQFCMPEDYPDDEFGFYRRVCGDRQEVMSDEDA